VVPTLHSVTSKDNVEDHLEVVKYLYSKGVKDSKEGINLAAENGRLV
jgi:hypothetical protein